jgi:predicted transcriptional regulator
LVRGRKSKKDRVLELTEKGNSVKEVATMLGASESYVNKVKSINRMESAISSNSKSEDLSIPINADVELANKKGKVRSKNIQVSSISPSIRKKFYGWLDSKKPLVDFIKRTGVDGRLLEEEYEIYLKLKDSDWFELQKNSLH